MKYSEIIKENFLTGERVKHKTQKLGVGTVVGYEDDETAVKFDNEPNEIYYVPNEDLVLAESTVGGSSSGCVATSVSALGAGDPAASIYYKKKNQKMPVIKRQVKEKSKKTK